MKLHNKNTGSIIEIDSIAIFKHSDDNLNAGVAKYKTIAELNEYWEDYTPKEPLIKDEKILKAVRAWAEANDIEKALFEYWWYSDLSAEMRVENYDNRSICIKFNVQKIICKANIIYTIEELCGEGNND